MLDILLVMTAGSIISEIIVIAAILIVLFVVLSLGKLFLGLLLNSILGLIALYIVNSLFGLGIAYNLVTIVVVAIFGLPAVAVIIILKLIGISI